jgi:hypothetical protein
MSYGEQLTLDAELEEIVDQAARHARSNDAGASDEYLGLAIENPFDNDPELPDKCRAELAEFFVDIFGYSPEFSLVIVERAETQIRQEMGLADGQG